MNGGRRSSVVTLAALGAVALLAFALLWQATRDAPKLAPRQGRTGEAAAASDAPADATGVAADATEASREEERGAAASGASRAPPPSVVPTRESAAHDPLQRVQLRGVLVDEHDRPVGLDRLLDAVAGGRPRVWLSQRGQRLGEFTVGSDGLLLGALIPPQDRSGLEAEVMLGERRFAAAMPPDLRDSFTLRVDFSSLGAVAAAATIVVRPNPKEVEHRDKFVVLYSGASRRAALLDADGCARFTGLEAGRWRGVAVVEGHPPAEFPLELREREERELLVELSLRAFRIAGTVAWDGLDAPLPPCTAFAIPAHAVEIQARGAGAPLGGDGTFELGPLKAGDWRLLVVRVDGACDVLHESIVTLGGAEVERLDLRIAPRRPPTRVVRLLLQWPAAQPRDDEGFAAVQRALLATFLGADGKVVGRGVVDPRSVRAPALALPEGATVLELAWRDFAGSLLLDSGVAVTRVPLPRVVQEGKSSDLKVELAAAPRD